MKQNECMKKEFCMDKEFDSGKEKHVGHAIKTLHHLISREIAAIFMKNGMDQVTVMHSWIIGYLCKNQNRDIFQKDLETEFGITRSTVTNILKLMEKKGYIERVSVESDARLKKLILTEKAKEIQKKNRIDIYNNVEKKLTQEIDEEELEVFFKVLSKMKQNMEHEKGATT